MCGEEADTEEALLEVCSKRHPANMDHIHLGEQKPGPRPVPRIDPKPRQVAPAERVRTSKGVQ